MAKPPRRKRVNLDVECDAFGCRPKSKAPGSKTFSLGLDKDRNRTPKPIPRFDWEVERTEEPVSTSAPQTDVELDISEVSPRGEKQLFKGTYQEAQMKDALKAAAEASKTFTPVKFPQFQAESEKSLIKGGQYPRTISPTAKPGEQKLIGAQPQSIIKEQAMRQRFGADFDIAKEGKLRSRTRYRTDPKTGERVAVKKIEYGPGVINEMNLETGVMKITDLSTGKTKYTKTPTIEVQKTPKEGVKRVKSMESAIEEGENADATETEIKKAQLKAAVEAAKKSKPAKRRKRSGYGYNSLRQ